MRVSNSIVIAILSMSVMYSCRKKEPFAEAGDKDMSVQVVQLKDNGDGAGLSYKARLVPDKKLLQGKSKEEKDGLLFKMDSCFYIDNGRQKIYASMVQPVANGVEGTYEYLLLFDDSPNSEHLTMVYHDKYISKKNYTLRLVKE